MSVKNQLKVSNPACYNVLMPSADSNKAFIKQINPLSVRQADEQVICEVNRSPIGMFAMYAGGAGLVLLVAILSYLLLPNTFGANTRSQLVFGGSIFLLAAIIVTGFLFLANKIYWDNYWIVTADGITQVTRTSLLNKEASQLGFGDLEDISAQQNGLWAQLFHFGVLSAETAAATDKFTLTFCPNPASFAQKILTARQDYEDQRDGKKPPATDSPPQVASNDSSIDSYNVPMGDEE